MSDNGTMSLPKDARLYLGLTGAGSVLVFAGNGCVTLTAVPLPDDLLRFAADTGSGPKETGR